MQEDDRIIITGKRQMIVLYPDEIRELLKNDLDLYEKALKRGKSEKRIRDNMRRMNTV